MGVVQELCFDASLRNQLPSSFWCSSSHCSPAVTCRSNSFPSSDFKAISANEVDSVLLRFPFTAPHPPSSFCALSRKSNAASIISISAPTLAKKHRSYVRIRASKDQSGPSSIGANQLSPQFRVSILFSVIAKAGVLQQTHHPRI